MKKIIFQLLALSGLATAGFANNILVSNAQISGQNVGSHYSMIGFDVSWENSWRTSTNESNYDGAWVFVKFRKNGTLDWRHATINTTGFTAATGSSISVPSDGKGLYIFRNANGIGNVNFTANSIRWNYGIDGVLDNETVEIRVFAVEMVYVPTGSFYLGSGGTEQYGFKTGATTNPYLVTNAGITWGTSGSDLNSNGMGLVTGTVPPEYPTGYNAFWMMKYEISEQQFVDFLNHLDLARANANNTPGIFTGTHPNLVAPSPERALGKLNSGRLAALADWSGLRPCTEMEFEKACRGGNIVPVPNEYAWGSTSIYPITGSTDPGLANEAVAAPSNANANAGGYFPTLVRTGIFARTAGSTRELSGASYYGIMNLGDNVKEIVISAGNTSGLSFNGNINGDGNLNAGGNSDIVANTNFIAYGVKGGSVSDAISLCAISNRVYSTFFQTYYGNDAVLNDNGGRLVRTAP